MANSRSRSDIAGYVIMAQGSQPGHAVTNSSNHTKPLTGPAAVAELQRQVSKSGVANAEKKQKEAIDKKYPGLYKKSK